MGIDSRTVGFSMMAALALVSTPRAAADETVPSGAGMLGAHLAAIENEDFFVFFRLHEQSREKDARGDEVAVFKPDNPSFAKRVTIRVTLGPQSCAIGFELDLARSFIEDSEQGIFAADIARSFLGSTPSGKEVRRIAPMIAELRALGGARPEGLPTKPSAGFLTYVGQRSAYKQMLPSSSLNLENVHVAGEAWLRMQFVATPKLGKG